jgi:hypothetical protein
MKNELLGVKSEHESQGRWSKAMGASVDTVDMYTTYFDGFYLTCQVLENIARQIHFQCYSLEVPQ